MKDKIFIVPKNDLESVEIIEMLKQAGYEEGKNLFITGQQWGASWNGLEPEIADMVNAKTQVIKVGDSVMSFDEFAKTDIKLEETKLLTPNVGMVYGVELKGDSPYNNIDHHSYCDKDWNTGEILYQDDRTKKENGDPKQTSIEQVAELIGVELTLDQKFIAANDRGFVEAMRDLGHSIGMSELQISQKITDIRMREHEILAKIQGITPEMEKQAIVAIKEATYTENGCMVISLPHSKCATVTDRIPEQEYDGGLLIVCGDGERDYYGPSEKVAELSSQFGGWTGDVNQEFTFWGAYNVDPAEIIELIEGRNVSGAASGNVDIER